MQSYYYQIRDITGKKIIGGSVHADSMDSAYNLAMKRENIVYLTEYYSKGSLYEGMVWRKRLTLNNRPVSLLIGK